MADTTLYRDYGGSKDLKNSRSVESIRFIIPWLGYCFRSEAGEALQANLP